MEVEHETPAVAADCPCRVNKSVPKSAYSLGLGIDPILTSFISLWG